MNPKHSVHLQLCFVMLFIVIIDNSALAMKCYKCTVSPETYTINNVTQQTKMCSKFDESDDYVTDCPYSTMCVKSISTLYLQNSQKQDTVERGCAQQKDTTQVYTSGGWKAKHTIQEVFEETCVTTTLDGSTKTLCYCRGDLCNTAVASAKLNAAVVVAVPVILAFRALYTMAF